MTAERLSQIISRAATFADLKTAVEQEREFARIQAQREPTPEERLVQWRENLAAIDGGGPIPGQERVFISAEIAVYLMALTDAGYKLKEPT